MANADHARHLAVGRPQSCPRLASGAGARAKAAVAAPGVLRPRDEVATAVLALSQLASKSSARRQDPEMFSILNSAIGVENVAASTTGRQILARVIHRVPVKVINYKNTLARLAARLPSDRIAAVMARVSSRPYSLVQDRSMFRNVGTVQRERVTGGMEDAAVRWIILAPRRVGALLRAMLARLRGDAGERCATVSTGVLHLATQTVRRARLGAEASGLSARPIAESGAALFAIRSDVLAAASSRAGTRAVLPYLRLSTASVFTPALITVPRNRRHA